MNKSNLNKSLRESSKLGTTGNNEPCSDRDSNRVETIPTFLCCPFDYNNHTTRHHVQFSKTSPICIPPIIKYLSLYPSPTVIVIDPYINIFIGLFI